MGKYTGESYQPSNGTEGAWFIEEYCMNCINCDPDPNGPKQCKILCASMCFSPGEKGYPEQWIYDENDEPSCTAWVKWDWGNDGDPDDPDNPKRPIPEDPNQLCFPFLLDEIGVKAKEFLPINEQAEKMSHEKRL